MKTSELTGAALDWAVAQCEGALEYIELEQVNGVWAVAVPDLGCYFEPSTDWAQAGPIIEREKITLDYDHEGPTLMWKANHFAFDGTMLQQEYGPTPLIAAMRCYVASKLGNDVEIPKELT